MLDIIARADSTSVLMETGEEELRDAEDVIVDINEVIGSDEDDSNVEEDTVIDAEEEVGVVDDSTNVDEWMDDGSMLNVLVDGSDDKLVAIDDE